MKKTFACDERMIITIPIGSLQNVREGQLMPEKFMCVYKDSYKVFVINGKPKPLGVSWILFYHTGSIMIFFFFFCRFQRTHWKCNVVMRHCSLFLIGSSSHCWCVPFHPRPDFFRLHSGHHDLHYTQCSGKCNTTNLLYKDFKRLWSIQTIKQNNHNKKMYLHCTYCCYDISIFLCFYLIFFI